MKRIAIKPKPLGRWHRWWITKLAAAEHSHGAPEILAGDWSGTVQGRALAGIVSRGLARVSAEFGPAGLITLTPAGADEARKIKNKETT